MTEKYTDVSYKIVPEDEDCILNAVQIGKIIDEPASTVRTWAKECEDYLYIKRINGSLRYTQASIQQFQDIKVWRREKDYPFDVIREIMKKRGEGFGEFNGGLIDPKDPLGYEVLAEKILQKNEKMLKSMFLAFDNRLAKRESEMLNKINEMTSLTVQEVLEANLPSLSSDVINKITAEIKQTNSSIQEVATDIEDYLDKNKNETIERTEEVLKSQHNLMKENLDKYEQTTKEELNRIVSTVEENYEKETKMFEDLKFRMEQRKKESEERESKKGFFAKLFK